MSSSRPSYMRQDYMNYLPICRKLLIRMLRKWHWSGERNLIDVSSRMKHHANGTPGHTFIALNMETDTVNVVYKERTAITAFLNRIIDG